MNWRDISYLVDGGDEKLEKLPTATIAAKTGKRVGDEIEAAAVPADDLERVIK